MINLTDTLLYSIMGQNYLLFFPPHRTYFTQTFWVVWQTVLSFLLPVLPIFTCWAVMIHHFLTRDLNRWQIIYLFNIATFSRSVLKSVTIKAMCVTGFFLICTFPFCIVFFMVGCRIHEKNLKSEAFYSKEGIIILQDIKILHKGTMPMMLANRFDIMYMTLNETTCGLYLGLPEAIFYHSSIHHDWYSIYFSIIDSISYHLQRDPAFPVCLDQQPAEGKALQVGVYVSFSHFHKIFYDFSTLGGEVVFQLSSGGRKQFLI